MSEEGFPGGGDVHSELLLAQITVDKAPDPVLWIGRDARVLYGNEAACRHFGYGREELLSLRLTDLDLGVREEDIDRRWNELVDRGSLTFETSLRAANGRLIPVEVTSHHVAHPGGELGVSILRDLTHRREAERRLRESEERFREMAELLPEAVFEADLSLTLTYANRRALELFGYGEEDLARGMSAFDTLVPQDRLRALENMERRRRGEEPGVVECTALRKDGSTFPILFHAGTILRGGELVGVRGVIVDLSERRKAEEEARASGARVQRLIEASPMGMLFYRLEEDGRLVLTGANSAADRLLGVDTAAYLGATIEEAFPGLADTEVPDRYRETAARGIPWQTDQIAYDDGQVAGAFEVVAFQIFPGEMVALFTEITERKRAEEALRESEKRFRSVVEGSNDAIYILFQDRFDLVNRRFCELAGVSEEEVKSPGFSFWSLVDPESLPVVQDRQERRARGERVPGVYDFIIRRKDGSQVEVEASVTEIEYRGGRAVLGILRDNSEQAKLEEQLRLSQRMESIGRLSGGVAHDLNNLLSPILVYGEILLADLGQEDSRGEMAEEIVAAARRSRDLIHQLLAFSRNQTLQFQPVDLNSLITDFQKLLRRTIREDVRLELVLAPDLPLIQADLRQVEQVIMNLAVNAEDAMSSGGNLTIETAAVELDQEYAASRPGVKPGRYVLLAMRDDGEGMDKDTMEMVFEPFFTTKEKGTGLGLATVYGIVKQHGGNIWTYSEPGMGTAFKCYFPAMEGNATVPEAGEPRSGVDGMPGSETILVVEDESSVRTMVERILRRQGYKVLSAADGKECLELLEGYHGPLDLILSDVVLPGMKGRALVEEVNRRFPAIKALFMSGYTDDVITRHGVLEEGIAFLQKPFTVQQLASRIREVLDVEAGNTSVTM